MNGSTRLNYLIGRVVGSEKFQKTSILQINKILILTCFHLVMYHCNSHCHTIIRKISSCSISISGWNITQQNKETAMKNEWKPTKMPEFSEYLQSGRVGATQSGTNFCQGASFFLLLRRYMHTKNSAGHCKGYGEWGALKMDLVMSNQSFCLPK